MNRNFILTALAGGLIAACGGGGGAPAFGPDAVKGDSQPLLVLKQPSKPVPSEDIPSGADISGNYNEDVPNGRYAFIGQDGSALIITGTGSGISTISTLKSIGGSGGSTEISDQGDGKSFEESGQNSARDSALRAYSTTIKSFVRGQFSGSGRPTLTYKVTKGSPDTPVQQIDASTLYPSLFDNSQGEDALFGAWAKQDTNTGTSVEINVSKLLDQQGTDLIAVDGKLNASCKFGGKVQRPQNFRNVVSLKNGFVDCGNGPISGQTIIVGLNDTTLVTGVTGLNGKPLSVFFAKRKTAPVMGEGNAGKFGANGTFNGKASSLTVAADSSGDAVFSGFSGDLPAYFGTYQYVNSTSSASGTGSAFFRPSSKYNGINLYLSGGRTVDLSGVGTRDRIESLKLLDGQSLSAEVSVLRTDEPVQASLNGSWVISDSATNTNAFANVDGAKIRYAFRTPQLSCDGESSSMVFGNGVLSGQVTETCGGNASQRKVLATFDSGMLLVSTTGQSPRNYVLRMAAVTPPPGKTSSSGIFSGIVKVGTSRVSATGLLSGDNGTGIITSYVRSPSGGITPNDVLYFTQGDLVEGNIVSAMSSSILKINSVKSTTSVRVFEPTGAPPVTSGTYAISNDRISNISIENAGSGVASSGSNLTLDQNLEEGGSLGGGFLGDFCSGDGSEKACDGLVAVTSRPGSIKGTYSLNQKKCIFDGKPFRSTKGPGLYTMNVMIDCGGDVIGLSGFAFAAKIGVGRETDVAAAGKTGDLGDKLIMILQNQDGSGATVFTLKRNTNIDGSNKIKGLYSSATTGTSFNLLASNTDVFGGHFYVESPFMDSIVFGDRVTTDIDGSLSGLARRYFIDQGILISDNTKAYIRDANEFSLSGKANDSRRSISMFSIKEPNCEATNNCFVQNVSLTDSDNSNSYGEIFCGTGSCDAVGNNEVIRFVENVVNGGQSIQGTLLIRLPGQGSVAACELDGEFEPPIEGSGSSVGVIKQLRATCPTGEQSRIVFSGVTSVQQTLNEKILTVLLETNIEGTNNPPSALKIVLRRTTSQ